MKLRRFLTAGLALALAASPVIGNFGNLAGVSNVGVMTAYADDTEEKTASVTITGSDVDTYTAYKLLNATTYISESGTTTYTYTVNPTFRSALIAGINAVVDEEHQLDPDSATIDDEIIATLEGFKEGTQPTEENPTIDFNTYSSEDMDKFAHGAMEVIKGLTLDEGDSYTSAKGGVFDSLAYGYYLFSEVARDEDTEYEDPQERSDYIIATAVTKDQTLVRKVDNVPGIEKKVSLDGETWVDAVTTQLWDTVYFKITADVPTLKENYTIYDYLKYGLRGVSDLKVMVDGKTINTATVKYYYEDYVWDESTKTSTLVCRETSADKADYFSVSIPKEDLVSGKNKVVLMYQSKGTDIQYINLKDDSSESFRKGCSDTMYNSANIEYANDHKNTDNTNHTDYAGVVIYNIEIDINKYATVDSKKVSLAGAEFVLKDTNGNIIPFVQDEWCTFTYRIASSSDAEGATETVVTGQKKETDSNYGNLVLQGLGEGTYTLTETKAPDGFALDPMPYIIVIDAVESDDLNETDYSLKSLTATITHHGETTTVSAKTIDSHTGIEYVSQNKLCFDIENTSGTLLPSTGGTGIYAICAIGIVLMACVSGTVVLKKKETKTE